MKKKQTNRFNFILGMVVAVGAMLALPVMAANPEPQSISLDPASTPANGTFFQYGEEVIIRVVFDIPIQVFDGSIGTSPYLTLGGISPSLGNRAVYEGHSGNTLYLKYTVQAGDYAFPLTYPSDMALAYVGTTVIYDAAGLPAAAGDLWRRFTDRIPAPADPAALAASSIHIRTMSITPAAQAIAEGGSQLFTISRGGPRATLMDVNLTSGTPSVGTVPATVTIPATAVTVQFWVTGLSVGATTITADGYPLLGAAADETATLTVGAGAAPTFSIIPPALIYEGINLDPATYPYQGVGTISLSRAAIVPITVTLTSGNPARLGFVGAVNTVTFLAGETNKAFNVEGLDGNVAVQITGVATAPYISDGVAAWVSVLNVPPVLNSPGDPWVLANSSEGRLVTFTWSGTDVNADLTKLEAYFDFGDGNNSGWIPGDSGSVAHIYNLAGQFGVTVRLRDTDGGQVERSTQIVIDPATRVLITDVIRGLPPGYRSLPGLGDGTVDDAELDTTRVAVPGSISRSWTIKYSPTLGSVGLVATPIPTNILVNAVPVEHDSFFHVWVGDGFLLAEATEPIASPTAQLELGGQDRDIQGVFAREFAPADNYADIDLDALPDRWEEHWFPDQRRFETPNRMGNDDGDFLPRGANADMAYPAAGGDYTPDGAAFGHVYEVRGLDMGLNAVASDPDGPLDEPRYKTAAWAIDDGRDFFGTDPTNPDTDGDGMSDGWEYYFWMNAKIRGITGFRYNAFSPLQNGAVITAFEIEQAFHPLVPGNPRNDLDGDGLSNIEEYALGTNPIMWDSDGDFIADGWEVSRGMDPTNRQDSRENPDGDYMAADGWLPYMLRGPFPPAAVAPLLGNVHYRVYDLHGYDPRTGWGESYVERDRGPAFYQPNTSQMLNIDEYAIMQFWIDEGIIFSAPPNQWARLSTNPFSNDTDGDGAPDGWEAYVYFDPSHVIGESGPMFDVDMDGLYLEYEFAGVESSPAAGARLTIGSTTTAGTSTNATTGEITTNSTTTVVITDSTPLANINEPWWNKFWPTDPNNADTDGDYVTDLAERGDFGVGPFLYTAPEGWSTAYIRGARAGGGLNPCSVDTDMDFIPDFWEVQYRYGRVSFMLPDGSLVPVAGMDGSIFDSRSGLTDLTGQIENYDYDGDGLQNYQEYYANAMWHFNYDKWSPGLGVGAYPPAALMTGRPLHWDWAIAANYWQPTILEGMAPPFHVPYVYIEPEPRPLLPAYASTDPSLWDSDGDGMDDHYEMYYGLNPLWSETVDIISKGSPVRVPDFRVQPWLAGESLADPDQDGIPNWEEAIFPGRPAPENLNSSPSPHWVTDTTYEQSWVNLYYRPQGHAWMWMEGLDGDVVYPYPSVVLLAGAPPSYVYSFANDEGYDTDNDNIPDRMEVTGANDVGMTDITDFDSPRLRKALYLDGDSAARTKFGVSHELNQLRSWTVELWVRPEEPVSPTGERQIIIERPLQGVSTDPMPAPELVRRTFRIGLEANGRPFAEYNNMGNELLSENIQGSGWTLQTNTWYHIAAVLDGENSQFSLYVNGQMAARKSTGLIPATGIIDANPPLVLPAPIVIGAADRNPNGRVQTPVPGSVTPPDLHSHFKGWVDEIRVWHGGRTQAEIVAMHMHRMTMEDVVSSMINYAARQAELPVINPPDLPPYQVYSNLPPVVLYHYAFDNLPDPRHDPIVPQGFELLNGRPNDGSYSGIPWWWQAPDRSRVYNDYRFVHWAENTVSHVPALAQVNRLGNVVGYQFGIVPSSPFWTVNAPPGTFEFRNKTYPSQNDYYTGLSALSQGGRSTTGLLPLWFAQADMDVPLWDNGTPGTSDYDSNGDGIADWWYIRHGFDPYGPALADEDTDGDGLSNYWEYRLGSDPNGMHSLDPTGMLTDAEYDSDGDGLPNLQEVQIFGTDPSLWDTDNGGLSDGQEVANHYNPLDSLSPLTNRVLSLSGAATDFVLMSTSTERFAITNWVIEAWVYPTAVAASEIIAREPRPGLFNYHLGMQADGRPAVIFDANTDLARQTLAADDPLPLNTWTHLRGGYDPSTYTLYIEVNGRRYETLTLAGRVPVTRRIATHQTRVGRGFIGMIDDVRIWSQAPLSTAVPALSHKRVGDSDILRFDYNNRAFMARGNEPGLVSWLRFDDGTITAANPNAARYAPWAFNVVEDFADVAGETPWLSQWRHHPRVQGSAAVVDAPADTPSNVMFVEDRNADGLPDWWQRQYWSAFDPYGTENGDWSPLSDPDGDGLSNMSEFLAGLNPRREISGGTGLKDGLRDSDGDGLINLYEQNVSFTRVDLVDTDDDGLTDWEEAMGGRLVTGWVPFAPVPSAAGEWRQSDPLNPLSPIRHRSAQFKGDGRLVYAHQDRHALKSWTLQAWVKATNAVPVMSGDAIVLRRRVNNTDYAAWTVNYELGVHTQADGVIRPYAQMIGVNPDTGAPFINRVDGTQAGEVAFGTVPIAAGEWIHLAATYSEEREELNLYLDGDRVSSRSGVKLPHGVGLVEDRDYRGELTLGGGELVAGAVVKGFRGYIDDALVLSSAVVPDPYASTTDAIDGVVQSLRSFATTSTKRDPMTLAQMMALPHKPGEMLVRFKHTITPNDVNKTVAGRLGVQVVNQYRIAPVYHMRVPDGVDLEQKLAQLRADADVVYAEPNFIVQTLAAPDDTRYSELWGMNNIGQTGGTAGADISAEQAWEYARGSRSVRVAIIDTGIDYNHPDLVANMWEGRGYDFHNGDDDPMDDHGHGTHCAGTVGAVGNNGMGVAGVAWEAEIMAVRVLGGDGGTTDNIIRGIEYAVENGAKVSNNSYGGYGFSQAEYDAVQAAGNAGHLFVAAAANDNIDNDGDMPAYPASFDLPNIIAVAASDHNDAKANFSNYGATSVDLAAPGVQILSTMPGGGYDLMSGTSMAAPHVTGAAVVLMALNPGMTYAQIKDLILNSVDVLENWNGVVLTGGRLNLGTAVGEPQDPGDPEQPIPAGLVAFFTSFDDGGSTFDRGVTVADLTMGTDWERDWLHAGTPTNVVITAAEFFNIGTDSNGDGIPDWWYIEYGADPKGESIALEDWDEDGINNYWEYRLGSDPHDAYSLWKQWVAAGGDRTNPTMFRNDSQWDSDSDGLTNGEETNTHLTDPTLPDTDDDGLTDKEEVDRTLDPLDSLMPYIMRFVRNESGIGRIEVPGNVRGKDDDGMRFNLNEWTLEATVRLAELPSDTGDPVVLVSRRCKPFGNLTFELGIGLNDRAYVRFHSEDASQFEYRLESIALMETGKWVSVAGRLSHEALPERQQLDIFVDSHHDSRELSNAAVALGAQYGPLVMAQGLRGDIDEVRIWNVARSNDEMDRLHRRKLHFGEDVATMGVLNVNGGQLRRNYTADVRLSTWTAEAWLRVTTPGVVLERSAGVGDDGVDIYNYRIEVNAEGYIDAIFSFNALVNLNPAGAIPYYDWRWATVTMRARNKIVTDDAWHFVSFSFNGRDAIIYVDGVAEDIVTIDNANSLPALGRAYWHVLEGEENPPTGYFGTPARMGLPDGGFNIGEGLTGWLDEVRVFSAGSTEAEIVGRRYRKVLPTADNLVSYYDFDDLSTTDTDLVMDKVNPDLGTGMLLQGAVLLAGASVNAPIEFSPLEILAPKLAAYFPMDEGTYTRLSPPRGFDGHQVKDFLRKLDFDFAGTFSRSDVYFMYNERKYTTNYLAHADEWADDTHFITDSDGDGMPDWWEVLFGLDPNRVATPDQPHLGSYGDPDKDGLSNLAEFLARTDPFDRDTTRSGFGDYDSRPSAFEPTFGQVFDDGDRIADEWEVLYMYKTPGTLNRSLDPVYYDAHLDPDEDGWSNYAEFMANTDPTSVQDYPRPTVQFNARYGGRYGDTLDDVLSEREYTENVDAAPASPPAFVYNLQAGQVIPLSFTLRFSIGNTRHAVSDTIGGNLIGSGIINGSIDHEAGTITVNFTGDATDLEMRYLAASDLNIRISFYEKPSMDGFPVARLDINAASENTAIMSSRYLVEGDLWLFAYLDINGDGEWDPVEEPAGISSFTMGWGDWNEVEIPLTDDRQMRGFPRLAWEPVPDEEQAVTLGYMVIAKQGRDTLFTRYVENPRRSYLHEGDYLFAGLDGVGGDGSQEAMTYEVYKNNTVYGYDFETPTAILIAIVTNSVTETPVVVTGHDFTYAYARNELAWTMDPDATWYQMTFRANSSTGTVVETGNALLTTGRMTSPFRDVNGHYRADLPFYAGDARADGTVWTNGRYWVQITTGMELGGSVSSAWAPFNLGVREPDQNDGKSMIEGKLYYFGGHDFFSDDLRRAGAVSNRMPVVVQSFSNPGFSGVPDAQVTIAPSAWTNTQYRYEAVFQLKGLHRGFHYLRAFVDSNRNGKLDYWETWGFNRDIQTYYEPLRISLESAGVMRVQDQMVIIRDRDTDDDGLPDIWEYDAYEAALGLATTDDAGFLTRIGGEAIGLNDLSMAVRWQYGLDAFTMLDMTALDQNDNRISDEWERTYFGALLGPGLEDADDDGDGMSNYDEYINGSDPLNPGESLKLTPTPILSGSPVLTWSGEVNYRVQYTDSLMASWMQDNNLLNYSRVAIGGGADTWTYTDPTPPVGGSRFYRVVIVPGTDPYP